MSKLHLQLLLQGNVSCHQETFVTSRTWKYPIPDSDMARRNVLLAHLHQNMNNSEKSLVSRMMTNSVTSTCQNLSWLKLTCVPSVCIKSPENKCFRPDVMWAESSAETIFLFSPTVQTSMAMDEGC